jgi:predicted membrane protein
LAPVGLTEYLREKADQTAIQQQHQMQQLEIETLERKIKTPLDTRNKLTGNIGLSETPICCDPVHIFRLMKNIKSLCFYCIFLTEGDSLC